MKYTCGYLPSVFGGVWVVYPKGSEPELTCVYYADNAHDATAKCAELNKEAE